jgi:hypothetical protein
MALSYGTIRRSLPQVFSGDVKFDATYTTGGLAFTPSGFVGASSYAAGPSAVLAADVPLGTHQGKTASWDRTTGKLVALTAAGVEVAGGVDLSAMTVTLVIFE